MASTAAGEGAGIVVSDEADWIGATGDTAIMSQAAVKAANDAANWTRRLRELVTA